MLCPECQEFNLERIYLKMGDGKAFLCENCGSFWFEGEDVKEGTAHQIKGYEEAIDKEYTYEDLGEEEWGGEQPVDVKGLI